MKKRMALIAGVLVSFMMTAASAISVQVNNTPVAFDVPPVMVQGHTMVPMRAIFETLGADIEWNGNTRTVKATRGEDVIQLTIHSATMKVNDTEVVLEIAPMMKEGRTMVPLRAISEAFHNTVSWDGVSRTVHILDDSGKADLSASHKYIPQTNTFSANIGEVKGQAYATRAVGDIPVLPVPTHGKEIANFAYYNGYVYYVLKDAGKSNYDTLLCRCLPDGSEYQVLAQKENYHCGFIISHNVLHWDEQYDGKSSAIAVDLLTLEQLEQSTPQYIMDGVSVQSVYDLAVYDDCYYYSTNAYLYRYDNGTKVQLSANGYEQLEGGIAGGYLYYVTSQNNTAYLWRVPVQGGSPIQVASHPIGDTIGLFF